MSWAQVRTGHCTASTKTEQKKKIDSELSGGQIKFSSRAKQRRKTVTVGLLMALINTSRADHYCLILSGGTVGKGRMADNIYIRLFSRVRGSRREAVNADLPGGWKRQPYHHH